MLKTLIATLILLSSAGLVAAKDYKHTVTVEFEYHEGYTEDSNFMCWIGDTRLSEDNPDFLKGYDVSKDKVFHANFDADAVTLNCLQDVTLPGGEQVAIHRIKVLY